MKHSMVPLFCTAELPATKRFYEAHFGFQVDVEMDGYAELVGPAGGPRLGFMSPAEGQWEAGSAKGLLYCFEVDDADAEYARLAAAGVTIRSEPEDKPWGERGFLAADPNGIGLYFGHPLSTSRAG